jgi:hypothetical protein
LDDIHGFSGHDLDVGFVCGSSMRVPNGRNDEKGVRALLL